MGVGKARHGESKQRCWGDEEQRGCGTDMPWGARRSGGGSGGMGDGATSLAWGRGGGCSAPAARQGSIALDGSHFGHLVASWSAPHETQICRKLHTVRLHAP